jgi:hypothetical protein
MAGVRQASLMTMAVARMVSRKSEILTGLLVSSSSLTHCAGCSTVEARCTVRRSLPQSDALADMTSALCICQLVLGLVVAHQAHLGVTRDE